VICPAGPSIVTGPPNRSSDGIPAGSTTSTPSTATPRTDVELLAVAGIRTTRPDLAGNELRRELASRRFGEAVVDEAYRHLLTG